MSQVSIEQLAEIVDGYLSLGAMPPVGGGLEPVGRFVTRSCDVTPGDVFWATQSDHGNAGESVLEAMLRAAQGAVTSGPFVEPWAGRFCVLVDDSQRALERLARWARSQFLGAVVGLVWAPSRRGETASLTEQLLRSAVEKIYCESRPIDAENTALSMLNWSDESECAILNMSALHSSEISKISHLCSPEIIAINSLHKTIQCSSTRDQQAFAETQSRFLQSLPSNSTIVLNGDDRDLREAAKNCSIETIVVGCESDSDVTASHVDYRGNKLSFDVEGVRFEIPGWELRHLPQALSGIVIGKLLALPLELLQEAARNVAPSPTKTVAA